MKPNKIFTSGSRVIVKTIDGCYEGLVAYYKRDPIQITLIDGIFKKIISQPS